AIEEVNHMGGYFLVHRFRALERERTFILARLVLGRAVGGLHPKDRARRGHAGAGLRVNTARWVRDPRDRNRCARRHNTLFGRALVDIWEANLLHRIQVIEVTPELLEAVRGRQGIRMVAEMVLAKLAGGVAEIQQEL